jgi:Na+-translocating ferredoxin:NAD+ oxidoreductase RNF subunit RnfB
MIEALIMMGGLGLAVGLVLAVAAKLFYVYVDPQIEAVASALPGANCGGCGLPGCSANAEAIVAGKSAPNSCVAAGPEVAEAIATLLGVAVKGVEPDRAAGVWSARPTPGSSTGPVIPRRRYAERRHEGVHHWLYGLEPAPAPARSTPFTWARKGFPW